MTAPSCRCATAATTLSWPTCHIQKDGLYHVAAVEGGEDVRLGEDYFIEAQKDHPPEVKITRPGRDFRASPIEEVTVAVEAKDDFGLKAVELHYSVNGGAGKGRAADAAPRAPRRSTAAPSFRWKISRWSPATW